MKIAAGRADQFIGRFDFKHAAVLLYGPDAGLISERDDQLARQAVADIRDPFQVVQLEAQKLKEDPALLRDEYNAIGLLGGRKLIRVREADNSVTAAVKNLLAGLNGRVGEALVVITTGELPPKSGLRRLFEESRELAAVACYNDDPQALQRIVAAGLREAGYRFSYDVPAYMAEHCQGDRQIVRHEVEKLQLYLGERREIAIEDVRASVGQVTESTLDDICHAVADGDYRSAGRHYSKALNQGVAPVAVLRALGRYFLRIKKVRSRLRAGHVQEKALAALRPPVFFKHKAIFSRHVTRWGGRKGKTEAALDILYRAELYSKRTDSQPELIGDRCIMKLAQLGKK